MRVYEEPAHLLGGSDRLIKDNVLVRCAETRTGCHFVCFGGTGMGKNTYRKISRYAPPTLRRLLVLHLYIYLLVTLMESRVW